MLFVKMEYMGVHPDSLSAFFMWNVELGSKPTCSEMSNSFCYFLRISSGNGKVIHWLLLRYNPFTPLYLTQMDAFPTSGPTDQKEASHRKHARALSPSEHVTYVLFQDKNLSVVSFSLWRSLPF